MPPATASPDMLTWALGSLGLVLSVIGGMALYIWNRREKDIEGLSDQIDTKASVETVTKLSEKVDKLVNATHQMELQNERIESELRASERRITESIGDLKIDIRGIREGLVSYGRRQTDA